LESIDLKTIKVNPLKGRNNKHLAATLKANLQPEIVKQNRYLFKF